MSTKSRINTVAKSLPKPKPPLVVVWGGKPSPHHPIVSESADVFTVHDPHPELRARDIEEVIPPNYPNRDRLMRKLATARRTIYIGTDQSDASKARREAARRGR